MRDRRRRIVERTLSKVEVDLISAAAFAIQSVHHAGLLGLILEDEQGTFITLQPGHEAEIAASLYDLDWVGIFKSAMACK